MDKDKEVFGTFISKGSWDGEHITYNDPVELGTLTFDKNKKILSGEIQMTTSPNVDHAGIIMADGYRSNDLDILWEYFAGKNIKIRIEEV